MKNYYYALFTACLLVVTTGCNKKNTSFTNADTYKKYSHQLEMDYPATSAPVLTASAVEEPDFSTPLPDSRYELATTTEKIEIVRSAIVKKTELKTSAKKSVTKRFVEKLALKRMEKILKRQDAQSGISGGNIITGIIVGIIGLVLIGIAGSTGAASLVYLGGVVLFIAGVLLVLFGIF